MRILTYDEARHNPAWDNDNHRTNPKLKDGDRVILRTAAVAHFSRYSALVEAGATGIVIHARTPRVIGPGIYFANIDVTINGEVGRVRGPHNAFAVTRDP